ncbi:unnamed protein product [Heligmosomoides polygyrus]|uniref:Uncharacterized protein n=1 Tax=Heligmosomoides polygyrus TaxID=6339 RepID=A0A183FYJ6_HELPZ|nr:unnamed protein product [Heligmosomoides polygyrus]
MRLAKTEKHEKISYEWEEWRLKELKKFGRTSSESAFSLRTFVQWSYKALYREEHSPMDADEDRVGNRGGVELYVAPLYRTMESSDPGPSV